MTKVLIEPRFARIDDKGQEIPDPVPTVVYMKTDPETGEILREGRPRPATLAQTLARSVGRDGFAGYEFGEFDDYDDDDFEVDEDTGEMPLHTPYSDDRAVFVDSMGPSKSKAIKMLKKAGVLPQDYGLPQSPSIVTGKQIGRAHV